MGSAPSDGAADRPLAVFKIVGATGALVLVGVWIFLAGKRRAARTPQET